MTSKELREIGNAIIETCGGGEDVPEAYTDAETVMWWCHRLDDDCEIDITEEEAEWVFWYIKDQIIEKTIKEEEDD